MSDDKCFNMYDISKWKKLINSIDWNDNSKIIIIDSIEEKENSDENA